MILHLEDPEGNAAALMDTMFSVLGDYAPQKRVLHIDYIDAEKRDFTCDAIVYVPDGAEAQPLMKDLVDHATSQGRTVLLIYEILDCFMNVYYISPQAILEATSPAATTTADEK